MTGLAGALSYVLGVRLSGDDMNPLQVREICLDAYSDDPSILDAAGA